MAVDVPDLAALGNTTRQMIHHRVLEFYVDRRSPLHNLPGMVKLAVALVLILVTALTPRGNWYPLIAVFALILVFIPLSRLPITMTLKRLLFLEPLVLGIALLAWFQPNGGLVFAAMLTKSTICLLIMILLTSTTSFSSLLQSLRTLRVPRLLVTTLALLYRYLFLMLDELDRLRLSRKSRTYIGSRSQIHNSMATTAAQLFVRTSLRAERVYAAMCSRGWKP
jgi:cobalt/nickel transport system permease protein